MINQPFIQLKKERLTIEINSTYLGNIRFRQFISFKLGQLKQDRECGTQPFL